MEINTNTTRAKIQYWALMGMLFILLVFCIFTFVYFKTEAKNAEENPFTYAAKRANADICTCVTGNQTINFNQERAWYVIEKKTTNISFAELNLENLK